MAITDSLDWPNRYVLPEGTTINAGGYLTISAAALGFGFSELGSDAALLGLSGSNIVRVVGRVSFPAVEREEPFGRYTRSDGEVDFTELLSVTPRTNNASPRVGPVVISEIMFAPNPGDPEYIEIVNVSDVSVALYDAAIPTNTWAFSGVGDYSFPEGVALQPNETAILCATNPAAFRARHGLDAEELVFGPWNGGLALEGEKLRLLSPGDPEPDGTVPMYRADHVSYRTNSVWPAASSGGISLERWPLSAYGNDPASWRASPPGGTPGLAFAENYSMGATISTANGDYRRITFHAILGESYEVHYADQLIDADWQPLVTVPSATTNWIEVIDDSPRDRARYYRIIWSY